MNEIIDKYASIFIGKLKYQYKIKQF